ncbi:hypothetical protein VCRA2110O135_200046 [Vibrio crassostreae]|nr:hypothetical protein VCRA2110O135_200046 [Vibrio crassostreae]
MNILMELVKQNKNVDRKNKTISALKQIIELQQEQLEQSEKMIEAQRATIKELSKPERIKSNTSWNKA